MPAQGFRDHLASVAGEVEETLDRLLLPGGGLAPGEPRLWEAMRYATLGGGKRLRAYLAVETAALFGVDRTAALRAGAAVECVHAYSLVHDDLPAMDDDDLRRGKPTAHRAFDEATAILAGDALQALAFELLTPEDAAIQPAVQAHLCRLLAVAAGHAGMAGGQAIDLASVGRSLDEAQLREMHSRKTGSLLQGSVLMGAACGATDAPARAALADYGAATGLAFQVVDDILDVTEDSATLGKTAGKDAAQDKPTYVSVLGLDGAARFARELLDQALAALSRTGLPDTRALQALAMMVVNRDN
jgi:farnesyl diphosphate synthase